MFKWIIGLLVGIVLAADFFVDISSDLSVIPTYGFSSKSFFIDLTNDTRPDLVVLGFAQKSVPGGSPIQRQFLQQLANDSFTPLSNSKVSFRRLSMEVSIE